MESEFYSVSSKEAESTALGFQIIHLAVTEKQGDGRKETTVLVLAKITNLFPNLNIIMVKLP